MKMKLFLISLIFTLAASACTSAGQAVATQAVAAEAAQTTPAAGAGRPEQPGEMPQAMKLAIGTLKLEGTANAVTDEQAAELLPLWKAVRSLTNSQTAAAAEVQAVFNQIEKAMTAEQMSTIDEMQVSLEDLAALGETLGVELGRGPGGMNGTGAPSAEIQATMQARRATAIAGGETVGGGGGPPGGFVPGMGGPGMGGPGMGGAGAGGDTGLSEEARATAMAQRGPTGAQTGVSPALVDAIIQVLEGKDR